MAHWDQKLFFPTRVITAQSDDHSMVEDLRAMFRTEEKYHDQSFNDRSDEENLLDQAGKYPVLDRLKRFMWDGMTAWLKAENISGDFAVHTTVFPNYSKKGAFVPAHNHIAHVSGVYYVDLPDFKGQDLYVQEDGRRYWAQDKGVLILHDPRFNASLAEITEQNYAKVFPRTGMAIIFPSYLWHSVTPHAEDKDRISIAFNYTLTPKEQLKDGLEDLTL